MAYTYTTSAKITAYTGHSTSEISDADLQVIENDVSTWVDWATGGNTTKRWETFIEPRKEDRFIVMKESADLSAFNKVLIDDGELFQYSKDNKVNNPDVSQATSYSATAPENWANGDTTGATLTWDTAQSKTGRYSLSILKSASGTAYWKSDTISVTDGMPYRFSAWMLLSSLTGGTGAWLRITWLDGSGTELTSDISSKQTSLTSWTEVTVDAYAPEGASTARLDLVTDADTSGTAYFDKFFFSLKNWTPHIADEMIEFSKEYSANRIQVQYTETSTPAEIVTLVTLMAARNALVRLVGGTATGNKYKFADQSVDKTAQSEKRLKLIEKYDNDIQTFLNGIPLKDELEFDYGMTDNIFDFDADDRTVYHPLNFLPQ